MGTQISCRLDPVPPSQAVLHCDSTDTIRMCAKPQHTVLRIKPAALLYWAGDIFEYHRIEVLSVSAAPFLSCSRHSNIDMKTQEAYELAVRGLIRPMGKSPPIITAIRCLQFAPPEFQLGRYQIYITGKPEYVL